MDGKENFHSLQSLDPTELTNIKEVENIMLFGGKLLTILLDMRSCDFQNNQWLFS